MSVSLRRRLALFAPALAVLLALAVPAAADAPFGDKVSAALLNYNRAAPMVATSGTLGPGGVAEVKALGFATIVDLRTAAEGTADEKKEAAKQGIAYVNIPVAGGLPSPDQVAEFLAVAAKADAGPILLHCASGNRAGAMWALARAAKGVPPEIAVEEGMATGLRGANIDNVRVRLGLAPRGE